jgi:predicted MFS family arabinose efflux permease
MTYHRSYRALLKLPSVGRLLLGMQIARIGQSMVSVAIVLFALTTYRSAALAGLATFFNIFPGLLVSPIAGALLDRHGRTRLVVLDYLVALAALTLMGTLAITGGLNASLLIVIAGIASLTNPLSGTGLRSLFPLIIPSHLWERVNAIDSTGFVIATIIGPPLAAGLVALWGGAVALIAIGVSFGVAAIVIAGSVEPPAETASTRSLLVDAREGLIYTWRNPTLRALGFSISLLNIGSGIANIVIPLIVLERLRLSETVVGLVFAVQGLAGITSAVAFGRTDTRDRERIMLAVPMAVAGIAVALLLLRSDFVVLILVMAIIGLLNGPIDVALFTLRQRRTDPAWTGRAFAVSMSFNYLGFPIGSALAGIMAARSIEAALACSVVACLVAGALAGVMIPSTRSGVFPSLR